MAKKNVYIKKLDIIDELGAATLVCTDKTGTLTQNLMILTDMWYNKRHFSSKLFVVIFVQPGYCKAKFRFQKFSVKFLSN